MRDTSNSRVREMVRRSPHHRRPLAMALAVLSMALIAMADPATGQELDTADSDAGYIDTAVIRNRVRVRFDAAYDNPFPDRAEFFYPTCGCFPGAPGPPLPESSVDYQELEADIEFALARRFSVFLEVPYRFIDPVANDNTSGFSDLRAGFKYGLIAEPGNWLTFQLRVFADTGDGSRGLGTAHPAIEPAFLFQRNETDNFSFFGEVRLWVPIDGNTEVFPLAVELGGPGGTEQDYAGPVVRYGLGAGVDLLESPCCCKPWKTTLVTEFVGWTVLDGLKERTLTPFEPIEDPPGTLNPDFLEDYDTADGDTIVNVKVGLRFSTPAHTVYVGYGRALTHEVWYENIVRAEYTYRF
jgi:hypothetical protein